MNRLRRIVLEELAKVVEGDIIPFHPRPPEEKSEETSDFDRVLSSIKEQLVSIESQLERAINELGPEMEEDEVIFLENMLDAVQAVIDLDSDDEMSYESEDFGHDDR